MLGAGTYSVANIYYFGPKKYHKVADNPNSSAKDIEDCANSIYPESFKGIYLAVAGTMLFYYGLYRNRKSRD
jgi:hypothetical protein